MNTNLIQIVISRILRLSDNDEKNIKDLIERVLINKEELIELTTDAINVGIGFNINTAKYNLDLVLELFI